MSCQCDILLPSSCVLSASLLNSEDNPTWVLKCVGSRCFVRPCPPLDSRYLARGAKQQRRRAGLGTRQAFLPAIIRVPRNTTRNGILLYPNPSNSISKRSPFFNSHSPARNINTNAHETAGLLRSLPPFAFQCNTTCQLFETGDLAGCSRCA